MADNSGNTKTWNVHCRFSLRSYPSETPIAILRSKPSNVENTAGQPTSVCLRTPGPYAAMFNVNFRFRLRLFLVNLFKPFVFMNEHFHPVCKPGGRGLCAFRFSVAAFFFARALRFLSLSCWAGPGFEEELGEEDVSSSSLELSCQKEIISAEIPGAKREWCLAR